MGFFAWAAGLGVNDFSAVDRRIEYLRRKLYEYDDTGRLDAQMNPQVAVQRSIDQRDYQEELEQLMYLRALPGQVAKRATVDTSIKAWQALLLIFFSVLAVMIASLALWMAI